MVLCTSSGLIGTAEPLPVKPRTVNKMALSIQAGMAVRRTMRPCSTALTPPTTAAVKTKLSDILAILSPMMAPETAAPPAMAGDVPIREARPTKATPTAPTVVKELPVRMLRIELRIKAVM